MSCKKVGENGRARLSPSQKRQRMANSEIAVFLEGSAPALPRNCGKLENLPSSLASKIIAKIIANEFQNEKITCPLVPVKKSTITQKPALKNSPKMSPEKKGNNRR